MSIDTENAGVDGMQVSEMLISDHDPRVVTDVLHDFDEGVEIGSGYLVNRLDHPARVGILEAKGARGFAHVDASYRNGVQTGLLVREVVK